MSLLFPSPDTLQDAFHSTIPFGRRPESTKTRTTPIYRKRTPLQARPELYTAWSTVDDAKDKAHALSAEATKEFEKASAKAQAKAGHIEMYSAKFYAACSLGGLVACVSASVMGFGPTFDLIYSGRYTHGSDPS
jgi:solute carrier family 25 phosphate transporter 3